MQKNITTQRLCLKISYCKCLITDWFCSYASHIIHVLKFNVNKITIPEHNVKFFKGQLEYSFQSLKIQCQRSFYQIDIK